jgi:hypothetical protein
MIHRELTKHPHHYSLLIVFEALLLTLFLSSRDQTLQILLALLVGVAYFFWGILTHAGELRTSRLMLEYAIVGLLASLMLIILTQNV